MINLEIIKIKNLFYNNGVGILKKKMDYGKR